MRAYDHYKISDIEWLEQLPTHWNTTKLKWIAAIYAGGTPSTQIDEYWENGSIPWLNSGSVNQRRITTASEYITEVAFQSSSTKWVPKDALVMALAGQGKTKGMVAIMDIAATCNQSMAAIVPDHSKLNSEYLFYWLEVNYLRIRGLAGSELRDGLNLEIVGNIVCPLPPLDEQVQIARYLNQQIALIDKIISQKLVLIDLAEEKRRSLLNETVTYGLPSSSTGVTDKTRVPADWSIKPLKYLASIKGRLGWKGLTADEYVENGYGFLATPDIKQDIIDFANVKFITEERYLESPEIMLSQGDVLLVKDGSTLGIVNLIRELPIPSSVNSSIAVIRVYDEQLILPEFLYWFLKSDVIQNEIARLKAGQGVPHLFQKDIKNMMINIPPVQQQKDIIAFISQTDERLNSIIKSVGEQIEKLKNYKSALTWEVVSGEARIVGLTANIVS